MPSSAPNPESPRPSQPPPRLLRLVYALAPLALLLAAGELLLQLAGVAPGDNAYFSRGFDASARYVVPAGEDPAPDSPGDSTTWVTRIYDGLHPEVILAPKGARRRVLLMGGSNVRRLSEDYLQQRLTELSPPDHPGWEVFNLGREGYGSERVAILLRQVLVSEPDVVVIYSGHNEFIERRFADELDDSMGFWERKAAFALSQLRTFRLLKSLWASEPPPRETSRPDERTPEEFQLEVHSFRELTWDGTLRYLEAYRRNLTQMMAAARQAGTRIVLCTLVSNDFSPPVLTNPRRELNEAEVLELVGLRDLSIEAEYKSPVAGLALTRRLRWPEWTGNHDAPSDYQPPALRTLTGRLADAPATTGPLDSIAGAHWTDPAGWSQRTIDCIAAFDRLLQRDIDDGWRALAMLHVQECEQALTIAPDDPDAQYDLAICLLLLGGQDDRAAELLRAAAAADRLPLAANATVNTIVREVAAAAAGANLLDADQLFRARCPDELIGFEVMMDHCHLQPGAGQVLLQDIADKVLELER